jgi:hypothetical protein
MDEKRLRLGALSRVSGSCQSRRKIHESDLYEILGLRGDSDEYNICNGKEEYPKGAVVEGEPPCYSASQRSPETATTGCVGMVV